MTEPEPERLFLLVAGNTAYLFDDQWMADQQHIVLIGANLDVTRFRPTLADWERVLTMNRDALPKLEIVDARGIRSLREQQ
jgi:hypothetical protein